MPSNREREAIADIRMDWVVEAERPIDAAFNRYGFSQMRDFAVVFCGPAWEAWATRDLDKFDSCFDWAWLPCFLKNCVLWDGFSGPCLHSDWREIASGFVNPMTLTPVTLGASANQAGEISHG